MKSPFRRLAGLFKKKKKKARAKGEFSTANAGMRVLMIGVGQMGARTAVALDKSGYTVAAVCDPSERQLAAIGKALPGASLYRDLRAVDAAGFDVVVVSTLAHTHRGLLEQLVAAGCRRIVCEKPIADTLGDIAAIRALSQRRDVRIAVPHPRSWSPDYRAVRDMANGGALGTLRSITAYGKATGFGNIGSHYLDLAMVLAGGRPVAVSGTMSRQLRASRGGGGATDPNGSAVFRMDNGVTFVLDTQTEASRGGLAGVWSLQLEHGQIEIWEGAGLWFATDYRTGLRTRHRFSVDVNGVVTGPGARRLFDAMICDLLADRETGSLARACDAVEAVVAAHYSSRDHGAAVVLPLDATLPPIHRFS